MCNIVLGSSANVRETAQLSVSSIAVMLGCSVLLAGIVEYRQTFDGVVPETVHIRNVFSRRTQQGTGMRHLPL